MTTINILQFAGYSSEDVLQYLHFEEPKLIEIIIPKLYDETDAYLIPVDYMRAAYIGQELSGISEEFMFSIPIPEKKGNFSFIIITEDLLHLARLLGEIIYAFTEDLCFELDFKSAFFHDDLPEGEEIACRPYLDIQKEFE